MVCAFCIVPNIAMGDKLKVNYFTVKSNLKNGPLILTDTWGVIGAGQILFGAHKLMCNDW